MTEMFHPSKLDITRILAKLSKEKDKEKKREKKATIFGKIAPSKALIN
jgi:hypothetical protein